MFPRRRTDQVYATLQQVQRRISEQGGQPSSVSTPAGMSAPRVAGHQTPGVMPAIRPGPQIPQHDLPPLLPPGVGSHQRYAVQISGTLASLLLVCWLASIAAAVLITKQWVKPSAALAVEPVPRAAVSAPTPAGEPRWKLIVLSEMRAGTEARTRLAKERDFLNGVAGKTPGWQPLFEIEEGSNGGIQLVFGAQGVEKEPWRDLYNKLRKRHGSASWVELR